MPSDAKRNPLQAWLQQRFMHHPDFRHVNIQCQDEQGLFWHKRHLYQQTPKQMWKMRFVKRIDYHDIQQLRIGRIDGHLSPPWLLYPQPLHHGLLFACVCLLLMVLLASSLRHLPESVWSWLHPALLSMVFFNVHEQLLRTFMIWKSNLLPKIAFLSHLPSWFKTMLRLILLILFFMVIGMPTTIYLQSLQSQTLKTVLVCGMVYLTVILVAGMVLTRRVRQHKPTQSAHHFVLQLLLKNGAHIDCAYAQDESVLHILKQHLQQQPRLQDACDGQTQS